MAGCRTSHQEISVNKFLSWNRLLDAMGCMPSKVAENKTLPSEAVENKTLPSNVAENKLRPVHEDFSVLASETPCE